MIDIERLDEDSEDLTEEEVNLGVVTSSQADFVRRTVERVCVCGGGMRMLKAELLRRKPHDYARINLVCAKCEGRAQSVFQIDWVRGA